MRAYMLLVEMDTQAEARERTNWGMSEGVAFVKAENDRKEKLPQVLMGDSVAWPLTQHHPPSLGYDEDSKFNSK